MGKGDNMIEKLPEELFDIVLDCLGQDEWSVLRLVSKRWNHLCLPLLFKRVAVVKHHRTFFKKERSDHMFLSSFYTEHKERYDFKPLCYKQLKELPSEELRKVIQHSTSELYLFYDKKTLGSNDEKFYGLVSGLFKDAPVRRIGLWFEPGRNDDDEAFGAFQGLVDQFKPSAKFTLAINLSQAEFSPGQVLLDTEGMNVNWLFFRTLFYHRQVPLPLWKVKGQERATWSDLAHMFKDAANLTLWRIGNIFEANWPQSIKYLHIMNSDGVSGAVAGMLDVPPEVEHLRITDVLEYNWHGERYRLPIFCYFGMTQIKQLKIFEFHGEGDVSEGLTAAILHAKDSLEHLRVFCRYLSQECTFDFRDVAKAGLGVKRLEMNTGAFGRFLFPGQSRFDTFLPNFPELECLVLLMQRSAPMEEGVRDFIDDMGDFVDKLLRAFVKACPKLKRIEMTCIQEIAVLNEAAWAQRCASEPDREGYQYIIDVGIGWAQLIASRADPERHQYIIDVDKSRAYYC